jgi:hypothetical protein
MLRKGLSVVVLVCFMSVTSACYGPFNLTRNVYQWNGSVKGSGEVSDKWMKELVFFGMIVIPVYMFSALLDAFIFNSLQFWTGSNPIKTVDTSLDGTIRTVRVGDTTITLATTSENPLGDVTYERGGRIVQRGHIVKTDQGYALVDEENRTLSSVELRSDGGLTWLNGDCGIAGTVSGPQLQLAADRMAG